jgi:large subunit ribosomal protein L24
MRIKRDDLVKIVAGDDKGKTGKVLEVFPGRNKLIVEGANMIWEHVKRSQKHPKGGRIQREAELDISQVMILCSSCDKPTRVKMGNTEAKDIEKPSRKKARLCCKCGKPVRPEE